MLLSITGLTKRYPTGDLALKGVDLGVPKGQVMALIGLSGAGKSSLIRCVNRLVEPTGGSVVLDGVELTGLGAAADGHDLPEYALVERLSVMENVLSGRLGYVAFWSSWFRRFPRKDVEEAFRLLHRVGLNHMVDEPIASLDPTTSRQIMRLIVERCEEGGLAAIINIHDVALAQQFARRIVGLRRRRGSTCLSAPPLIASALLRYAIYAGALLCAVLPAGTIEVNWARAAEGLERGLRFVGGFFPPDFTSKQTDVVERLLESLTMTVVSTVIGVALSIPVAVGASRNLAPLPIYLLCRGIITISRTFQEIIIAIVFVAMVGFGPLAGMLTLAFATIGFMAKLIAENIEDIA